MSSETKFMYQLKITLDGVRPPIWRRILVSNESTLDQLHSIIQIVMGWEDAHLHDFSIGDKRYKQNPEELEIDWMDDEAGIKLSSFIIGEKFKFSYQYDFGDSWYHTVLVEKILPSDPNQILPLCVKGKRSGPVEDVGGVWGYMHFVEAINDPNHPAYADLRDWYYGDNVQQYDAEAFDMNEVNTTFRKIFK
ncbi:MAG: plasmid pRiA4b ORF-3 family protein [Phototrophicales bacterium]|nr:plasmid pRiA4b ORF-3 family protein [Phototrophicales bacterium]